MSEAVPPPPHLDPLVDALLDSYQQDRRGQLLNSTFMPSREGAIAIIELLRRLVFPGFFDRHHLSDSNIRYHVGELLAEAHEALYEQIRQSLRYQRNHEHGDGSGDDCDDCDHRAREVTGLLLGQLADIRRLLLTDVQAAFDGDPAAHNLDETIFCYPGLDAIFTHRIAHALWKLDVPMIPRIMSEYAHNETGIDIHPGAAIGEAFFIDHGTGVVIGETSTIGNRVKIYQGVTLGALSTKGGQTWRGRKRHPTIEDDVTIYGGAIILGGETVIGQGATIGGSVFLTHSVPPGYTVTMKSPELKMSAKRGPKRAGKHGDAPTTGDSPPAADMLSSLPDGFDPVI